MHFLENTVAEKHTATWLLLWRIIQLRKPFQTLCAIRISQKCLWKHPEVHFIAPQNCGIAFPGLSPFKLQGWEGEFVYKECFPYQWIQQLLPWHASFLPAVGDSVPPLRGTFPQPEVENFTSWSSWWTKTMRRAYGVISMKQGRWIRGFQGSQAKVSRTKSTQGKGI